MSPAFFLFQNSGPDVICLGFVKTGQISQYVLRGFWMFEVWMECMNGLFKKFQWGSTSRSKIGITVVFQLIVTRPSQISLHGTHSKIRSNISISWTFVALGSKPVIQRRPVTSSRCAGWTVSMEFQSTLLEWRFFKRSASEFARWRKALVQECMSTLGYRMMRKQWEQ